MLNPANPGATTPNQKKKRRIANTERIPIELSPEIKLRRDTVNNATKANSALKLTQEKVGTTKPNNI